MKNRRITLFSDLKQYLPIELHKEKIKRVLVKNSSIAHLWSCDKNFFFFSNQKTFRGGIIWNEYWQYPYCFINVHPKSYIAVIYRNFNFRKDFAFIMEVLLFIKIFFEINPLNGWMGTIDIIESVIILKFLHLLNAALSVSNMGCFIVQKHGISHQV